jgi:hypothetical protein
MGAGFDQLAVLDGQLVELALILGALLAGGFQLALQLLQQARGGGVPAATEGEEVATTARWPAHRMSALNVPLQSFGVQGFRH